jgi:hypothetical protein
MEQSGFACPLPADKAENFAARNRKADIPQHRQAIEFFRQAICEEERLAHKMIVTRFLGG